MSARLMPRGVGGAQGSGPACGLRGRAAALGRRARSVRPPPGRGRHPPLRHPGRHALPRAAATADTARPAQLRASLHLPPHEASEHSSDPDWREEARWEPARDTGQSESIENGILSPTVRNTCKWTHLQVQDKIHCPQKTDLGRVPRYWQHHLYELQA